MQHRQMRLGVFVQTPGHHVAGWRHPDAVSGGPNLALMKHIATTAERGKFDMFFLGDGFATGYSEHPSTIGKFEPISLLSALAMGTSGWGWRPRPQRPMPSPITWLEASPRSTTCPADGRRGTSSPPPMPSRARCSAASTRHTPSAMRWRKSSVEACRLLWDSWDDDAFIADKQAGSFVRPGSLQVPDFKGKYFTVEGGLNVPRAAAKAIRC